MTEFDAFKALIEDSRFEAAANRLTESDSLQQPDLEELIFLRSLLFHPNDILRQTVVTTLGKAGDLASPPLMAMLYSKWMDRFDHDYIFEAFRQMGDPAVPSLARIAMTASGEERHVAVWGLGQMGGAAVPVLLELLDEGFDDVVAALINTHDSRCAPALLEIVAHREGEVSEQAASAFANCCDASCSNLVPEVLKLLSRVNVQMRVGLLEALGSIGDLRAVPAIARCLKLGGSNVDGAVETLSNFETPKAVEALWLGLDSRRVRTEARGTILAAIIAHPCSNSSDKERALRTALESCAKRYQAIDVFDEASSHECCVRMAQEYTVGEKPALSLAVATILSEADEVAALDHACYAFKEGDAELRSDCIYLFTQLGDSDSLRRAAKDPAVRVRLEVADSLAFGKGLPEATRLDILNEFVTDRSLKVRETALSSTYFVLSDPTPRPRFEHEAPFLFDKYGKPCDFVFSEVRYEDGRVEYSTLSDEISKLDLPEARSLISRWRSTGGTRATRYYRNGFSA